MDWLRLLRDFYHFLLHEKKWWLTPILLAILLLAGLAVATEGTAAMPFVYTLF